MPWHMTEQVTEVAIKTQFQRIMTVESGGDWTDKTVSFFFYTSHLVDSVILMCSMDILECVNFYPLNGSNAN